MTPGPVLHSGEVMVVIEGPARVSWRQTRGTQWRPTGLWPTATQRAEVLDRLDRGAPLLVVLDDVPATVSLLAEEFAYAPPPLAALAEDVRGEVVDLQIPLLDWLPDELRRRGLRFLHASTETASRTPVPLRPALVLDEPPSAMPNVRFAHLLPGGRFSHSHLLGVVPHVFGPPAVGSARGTAPTPTAAIAESRAEPRPEMSSTSFWTSIVNGERCGREQTEAGRVGDVLKW
jgi:hypothetical protein